MDERSYETLSLDTFELFLLFRIGRAAGEVTVSIQLIDELDVKRI
jgi:hypothetical protein